MISAECFQCRWHSTRHAGVPIIKPVGCKPWSVQKLTEAGTTTISASRSFCPIPLLAKSAAIYFESWSGSQSMWVRLKLLGAARPPSNLTLNQASLCWKLSGGVRDYTLA